MGRGAPSGPPPRRALAPKMSACAVSERGDVGIEIQSAAGRERSVAGGYAGGAKANAFAAWCVVVSPDRRTLERTAQPSERLESSWVSRTRRERVRSAPCSPLSRSSRRRATQRESPGGCPLFARQLFRAMESVRTSANDARARRSCRHRTRSSSRARGDSSRRHRDARAGRPSPPSGPRAAAQPARTARVVR